MIARMCFSLRIVTNCSTEIGFPKLSSKTELNALSTFEDQQTGDILYQCSIVI